MRRLIWQALTVAACGGAFGWMVSTQSITTDDGAANSEQPVATHSAVTDSRWALLAKQLTNADAATCEREYTNLVEGDWHRDQALLLEAWLARWLELDGDAAMAFVLEIQASEDRQAWHSEEEAILLWASVDGNAAHAYVESQRHLQRDQRLSRALHKIAPVDEESDRRAWYRRLALDDPKNALRKALAIEDAQERRQALGGTLDGWIASDPAAALAWAMTQLDGPNASAVHGLKTAIDEGHVDVAIAAVKDIRHPSMLMQRDLILAWQAKDAEAAAHWSAKQPSGDERNRLRHFFDSIMLPGKSDPEFVLHFAAVAGHRMRDSLRMSPALGSALRQVAARDPQEALTWLRKLPVSAFDASVPTSLASGWAKQDGEAAIEWVSQFEEPKLMSSALSTWTEQDPAAATAWLSARNSEPTKAEVANVIGSWPKTEFADAVTWMDSLSEERQLAGTSKLAFRWAVSDSQSAYSWLNELEEGSVREEAAQAFLRGATESWWQFGAEAMDEAWQVLQSLSDQTEAASLASSIFYRWAESDPESASVALSNSNANADLYANSFRAVGRQWAYLAPEEAAAWVHSLEGIARDHAAWGYAMSCFISKSHWHSMTPRLEEALVWVEEIQDEAMRLKGFREIFESTEDPSVLLDSHAPSEAKAMLEEVLRERVEQGGEE